jgi:hypothetical protein
MNISTITIILLFISFLKRRKSIKKKTGRPQFMTNLKIEGFEHILISPIVKTDGSPWVWNSRTRRWFISHKDAEGYWTALHKKRVSRLLALTFIPNSDPEHLKVVDHINRKRWDNNLGNLRWTSVETNSRNVEHPKTHRKAKQDFIGELYQIPESYIIGGDKWYVNDGKMSDYYISKYGHIKGKRRFIGGTKLLNGYTAMNMKIKKKSFRPLLHVLLGRMFKENPNPEVYNIVDHIDRTRDNNELSNLRWTDFSGNAKNKNKLKNLTSKYYGVALIRDTRKWLASSNGIRLGIFISEIIAAKAHDKEEFKNFGNNGNLNFPEEIDKTLRTNFVPDIREKSSGYNGVKIEGKYYRAIICGKSIGNFDTEEKAAKAYDKNVIEIWGLEKAKKKLNFPEEIEETMELSLKRNKKKGSSSKYFGVSKSFNKWRAKIVFKKKIISIGTYLTEREAAIAYDKKAIELLGYEKAKKKLNFP